MEDIFEPLCKFFRFELHWSSVCREYFEIIVWPKAENVRFIADGSTPKDAVENVLKKIELRPDLIRQ